MIVVLDWEFGLPQLTEYWLIDKARPLEIINQLSLQLCAEARHDITQKLSSLQAYIDSNSSIGLISSQTRPYEQSKCITSRLSASNVNNRQPTLHAPCGSFPPTSVDLRHLVGCSQRPEMELFCLEHAACTLSLTDIHRTLFNYGQRGSGEVPDCLTLIQLRTAL